MQSVELECDDILVVISQPYRSHYSIVLAQVNQATLVIINVAQVIDVAQVHGIVSLRIYTCLSLEQHQGVHFLASGILTKLNKGVKSLPVETAAGIAMYRSLYNEVAILFVFIRTTSYLAACRTLKHIHKTAILPVGIYHILKLHAYHNIGTQLSCHIGGKIILSATVNEYHVAHVHWSKHSWNRHAGANAPDKRTLGQNHLVVFDKVGSHTGELARQVSHEVDTIGISLQIVTKHLHHISSTNHAARLWINAATNIERSLIDIRVLVVTFTKCKTILGIAVEKQVGPIHSTKHCGNVITVVAHAI